MPPDAVAPGAEIPPQNPTAPAPFVVMKGDWRIFVLAVPTAPVKLVSAVHVVPLFVENMNV